MKVLYTTLGLLMSTALYAMAPFQHTGIVTAHFNDSSTIEIDGQAFLVNNETLIHHYENGILTEKVIAEDTSIGYEINLERDGVLKTISTIWLIRNDE
jgi:hypothetical protein